MKLSTTLQRFISVVFLVALCGGYAHAQRLVVVGWNIESGGATDAAIAQLVRSFQGVDIWGLAEVGNDALYFAKTSLTLIFESLENET